MNTPSVFETDRRVDACKDDVEQERLHRKQRLAGAFRLFSKFGFNEGVAGHITARDPEFTDSFWVNPFGVHFGQVCVSNLIRVDHSGTVVEGDHEVNLAAFVIHSIIHQHRPDSIAAAHAHSVQGRAWSVFGKPLDYLTQDVCAFYNDQSVYNQFGGVVVDPEEGKRLAMALGNSKAVILQNHGLLTVGQTVDSAAWWFICMERCCQVQLSVQAAWHSGQRINYINHSAAKQAYDILGTELAGWTQFQPLYNLIIKEQPDLLK